ncbi:MAG TPA: FMN-binding glutamate synthase family protein, partial [Calditrichia bacterium]|nr:FMN-binding glutamate synthase family protein [Calditrichia bacterium]
MNIRYLFLILTVLLLLAIGLIYLIWPPVLWSLVFLGPLMLLGLSDILQRKHAIKRNFPVIGNLRYALEMIRPEIMQYFVETDTQGRPINRLQRSLVYQRAKREIDTAPFGTQMDVYDEGYEWMDHSIYAKSVDEFGESPRVRIGGSDCQQPYQASILNISAMSFGALSPNAIEALNIGAKRGGFAQTT